MDTHFIDTSLLLTAGFVSGERKPLQISKFNLLKGAVSRRNSAKLGNYKMPFKLRET